MACHSGSLPVNFSDIDDQRAVLFVLSVFRTRPRVVHRAIHTSYPAKLSSVYIRINSHTSRAIYPSSCPPPHPSYIDSSIHFISLFLTAIFPTTNHLGTFAARLLVSLLLLFFFISLPHRFRREIGERNAGRGAMLHCNQYDTIAASTNIGIIVHGIVGIYSRLRSRCGLDYYPNELFISICAGQIYISISLFEKLKVQSNILFAAIISFSIAGSAFKYLQTSFREKFL